MDRYEVRSVYIKKPILGFQWNKEKDYFIYDTVRGRKESSFCSDTKESLEKRCRFKNAVLTAATYLVFLDGNGKYFVCYKTSDEDENFYDKDGVGYTKIGFSMETPPITASYSPCVVSHFDAASGGFNTAEEACAFLDKVLQLDEDTTKSMKEKAEFKKRAKQGTPITCI